MNEQSNVVIKINDDEIEVVDETDNKKTSTSNLLPILVGGCAVFAGLMLYKRVLRPLGKAVAAGFNEAKEEMKRSQLEDDDLH